MTLTTVMQMIAIAGSLKGKSAATLKVAQLAKSSTVPQAPPMAQLLEQLILQTVAFLRKG